MLSFLIHPDAPRGRPGNGHVSALTLAVPADSLGYWKRRLAKYGGTEGHARAFGDTLLCFADPDGLKLCLAADDFDVPNPASPNGIRRIQSVELQIDGFEHAAQFLENVFGFNKTQSEGAVTRFTSSRLEHPVALDIVSAPSHRVGLDGPGVTHHVAWRVRNREDLGALRTSLADLGLDVTPELDRHFFRAIYFRLPGGVRFALASEVQGFGPAAPDGLSLPPWLERRRGVLERRHALAPSEAPPTRSGGRRNREGLS